MTTTEKGGQSLAKQVPAAASGTVEWPVPRDGTLEHLKLRIYPGAETTLKLKPQLKNRAGEYEDVLDLRGKKWIDGDDDMWEWDLAEPLNKGDTVVLRYENRDGSNAHNFRVVTSVDYLNGVERAASWAEKAVRGVL